jgi:dTDP-4-dehydrorhamnose reductase
MKILILGITGLIGRTLFSQLKKNKSLEVYGSSRNKNEDQHNKEIQYFDYKYGENFLEKIIHEIEPEYIINCIGVTKHIEGSEDQLVSIPLNSLLPHNISKVISKSNSKLIQISSDCVYSGKKGDYKEEDTPDSLDLYGRSKAFGEVINNKDITIRTSTIGHEDNTNYGLLEWFLSQKESCFGYKNAFFSGLTTFELSKVIENYFLTDKSLSGLFHVAGQPISKFRLLELIAAQYSLEVKIKPNTEFCIDRTLNSSFFNSKTSYSPPSWEEMIDNMHTDNLGKDDV